MSPLGNGGWLAPAEDKMTIDFRVGAPIGPDQPAHRPARTLYGEAYGRIASQ